MPKCKKTYPNCIWILLPDWHDLNIYSALLTKVYWYYATDIVRVCVTAISPTTCKPDANRKSNIQIRFGSEAMGSLYELLCHHSFSSPDLLLDELLFYLPIFSTIFSMKTRMMNPMIPTLIYLLSTPAIQPISLKISKMIPMSTYQHAAQRLKQNTEVRDKPTPTKDSLELCSSSRKPPRAARSRGPARNSELVQTPKSHRNSLLSRAVVILNPVIAADDCLIIHSMEPLNTAFCPLMARNTKINGSGIGGSGTKKRAQLCRYNTYARQPFNR